MASHLREVSSLNEPLNGRFGARSLPTTTGGGGTPEPSADAFAVVLYFDDFTEKRVRQAWEALDRHGVPSAASTYEEGYRPHITLAMLNTPYPEQAAARLRADPRQFGALRGETWPNVQERVTTAAGAGRTFAEARAARPRLTLKELKDALREHDLAVAREGGLQDAVRAAARARIERQIAWESRARAVAAVGDMRDALPDTFADPRGAARRIWQAARAGQRPEQIAQDIRNGSERFGAHRAEAKTRAFGFGTRWDKSAALAAAHRLRCSLCRRRTPPTGAHGGPRVSLQRRR